MSDSEMEGDGKVRRRQGVPGGDLSPTEGEGKRPRKAKARVYRDKKGNRYVKDGKKRIVAPAGIVSDAAFLKWFINRFAPKRKKRVTRTESKAKPTVYAPKSSPSASDDLLQDEGYLQYKNTERAQAGKPTVDAPVVVGGPARIAAEELKAREERKRKREEEKKALVEEKKAAETKAATAETKAAKHEASLRKQAHDTALSKITRSENVTKEKLRQFIPKDGYPRTWTNSNDYTYEMKSEPDAYSKMLKGDIVEWLVTTIKTPKLVDSYNRLLQEEEKKLIGLGRGGGLPPTASTPMSNLDIDAVMRGYRPKYLGTIARNGWDNLTAGMPSGKSGWIMNTDRTGQPGMHWVAFLLDLDGNSIEYYNSFAEPLPKDVGVSLKKFLDQYGPHRELLKFKENRIIDQDVNSANCGWFCCKFLIDRFRGKSFREVTRYDDHVREEKNIEKFKEQHGGAFDQYY